MCRLVGGSLATFATPTDNQAYAAAVIQMRDRVGPVRFRAIGRLPTTRRYQDNQMAWLAIGDLTPLEVGASTLLGPIRLHSDGFKRGNGSLGVGRQGEGVGEWGRLPALCRLPRPPQPLDCGREKLSLSVGGSCYAILREPLRRSLAEWHCEQRGGRLATLDSLPLIRYLSQVSELLAMPLRQFLRWGIGMTYRSYWPGARWRRDVHRCGWEELGFLHRSLDTLATRSSGPIRATILDVIGKTQKSARSQELNLGLR